MKIELAHDILAKRIYDKSSAEDKMRHRIHQLLADRLTLYEDEKLLLSKDDLLYIKPFLDTTELDSDQVSLVKKSERVLKKQKIRLYTLIIFVLVLLIVFNLITWSANETNQELLEEEQLHVAALQKEDSLRLVAERRADTLYHQLLENNPEFTKELIASFDTLKTAKKNAEQQRNIAQSATLSNLAVTAYDQKDKNYAFRLAAKAWELNNENQLACKILYAVNDDPTYGSIAINSKINRKNMTEKEHEHYVRQLIAQERSRGRGELDKKSMEVIFNQQNTIVSKKEEGVRDKLENYYDKAQDKVKDLYKETKNALKEH